MKFEIPNMNCGGCAKGVTATIKEVDPNADVKIDIETKQVEVTTTASLDTVKNALDEDGFPPVIK